MTKYRFKTEAEFKAKGQWSHSHDRPREWSMMMVHLIGADVSDEHISRIENGDSFHIPAPVSDISRGYWIVEADEVVLNKTAQIIKENSNLISDVYEIEL